MKTTQEEVFDKVAKRAVNNALNGFNSTIFAYGQTGSGKTYTITGGTERYVDRGIIPRTLSYIFEAAKNRGDVQYKVYISYLELYKEEGFDLMTKSEHANRLEDLPRVGIRE